MKTTGLFIIGILTIGSPLLAQDTLFTVTGEKQCVKVCEVTATEVKYKKSANIDGPTYIVNKNTIALIEYKNGMKELYGTNSNPSDPTLVTTDPNNPAIVNNNNTYNNQNGGGGYGGGYGYGYGYGGGPGVAIALGVGGYYGGYRSFYRRPYYYGGGYRGGYGHNYYHSYHRGGGHYGRRH